MLPLDFGKSEKRTHDYKRNGTTDLYAGFDIVTGRVTVELSPAHNAQDFLRLMKKIMAQYAASKKIHIVLDNASVHTSGETGKWLAEQDGRVVLHFTPTGASWMNQIEIWNGIITRQLIRRGTFPSVRAVNNAINSRGFGVVRLSWLLRGRRFVPGSLGEPASVHCRHPGRHVAHGDRGAPQRRAERGRRR